VTGGGGRKRHSGAREMADVEGEDLFSSLIEWQDVEPIPQVEGVEPVVQILYDKKYSDGMSLVRALMASGERSARALHLTTELIFINSSHYTLWQYRRCILEALGITKEALGTELEFMREVNLINTKNYQLWNHRRFVMTHLGPSCIPCEIAFIDEVFRDDAKHYHAWAHRQWLVRTFAKWDGEMECTTRMIAEDVLNNSAWNHRFFVLTQSGLYQTDRGIWQSEVSHALEAIELLPDNESPWSFLKALLFDAVTILPVDRAALQSTVDALLAFCRGDSTVEGNPKLARHLQFAADLHFHLATAVLDPGGNHHASAWKGIEVSSGGPREHLCSALECWQLLGEVEDKVRSSLWRTKSARARALLDKHPAQ